jgi:hypothetical protein
VFEEDDASYPLASVCEACTTLGNIGKAFLGFGGIGLCLVTLVIVAIACSALGCGMFDGNGKFVIGLLNLSIFSSFLSMLLMLCGVAAMVAPEGDEYNFKVGEIMRVGCCCCYYCCCCCLTTAVRCSSLTTAIRYSLITALGCSSPPPPPPYASPGLWRFLDPSEPQHFHP